MRGEKEEEQRGSKKQDRSKARKRVALKRNSQRRHVRDASAEHGRTGRDEWL